MCLTIHVTLHLYILDIIDSVDSHQCVAQPSDSCQENVNTIPQMTSFLGAKRVHTIATGKNYDELLQHDNKMRI